jgi:hypothetical protein
VRGRPGRKMRPSGGQGGSAHRAKHHTDNMGPTAKRRLMSTERTAKEPRFKKNPAPHRTATGLEFARALTCVSAAPLHKGAKSICFDFAWLAKQKRHLWITEGSNRCQLSACGCRSSPWGFSCSVLLHGFPLSLMCTLVQHLCITIVARGYLPSQPLLIRDAPALYCS